MLKRKEIKVGGPRAFELCPQSFEGRELSVAVGPGVVLHCDSQSSEQLFRLGSNPGTSGLSRHDRCIRVGQVPSMTSSCGITNKNLTKITKIQDGITHQQDRTEPADSATHSRHDRHPFSPRQTPSRPALCFPAHPPFPHFSKPSPVQPLATHKGRRTRPETATMHALGPTDPRPNRTRKPPRHSAARLRHGRRGRPETGTNTELDAPDPPGCQAGSATTPFDFVSRLLPTTSQLRAGRGSRRNGRPIFPRGR